MIFSTVFLRLPKKGNYKVLVELVLKLPSAARLSSSPPRRERKREKREKKREREGERE